MHKKIVDQIIAVDNFMAFKKLMIKRNQELNQQALFMLSGGDPKKNPVTAGDQPIGKTPASTSTAAGANKLTEAEKHLN
ncbi:MAG: hypothetical protein ACMG6E_08010 [Candidatus Roizmanbacteria bacterium]